MSTFFVVVLWMMPSHEKAIALMQKISQSLVEAEMKGKPADMVQFSLPYCQHNNKTNTFSSSKTGGKVNGGTTHVV